MAPPLPVRRCPVVWELLPGPPDHRLARSAGLLQKLSAPGVVQPSQQARQGQECVWGLPPALPRHAASPSWPMGAQGTHLLAARSGDWSAEQAPARGGVRPYM